MVVNNPVKREPINGAMPVNNKMKLVPIKIRIGISHLPGFVSLSFTTASLGINRKPITIAVATMKKTGRSGKVKFCKIVVLVAKTSKLPVMAVCQRNFPAPLEYVAVNDSFGESGTPEQLMKKYGLEAENIVLAAEKAIKRKKPELTHS